MNLRRLETFYWAAKLGSFTAAAEKMNTTQSTISMRIQELEREFGVVLFDRTQRMARATELGRDLVSYVERLLDCAADMHERFASAESVTGTLRIGAAEVISISWLPTLIRRLQQRHPKVQLEIQEALTQDLEMKLEAGALDLVLAPGGAEHSRHAVTPLGSVEFTWMAHPSLGIPGEGLTPERLQQWPVIALSEESYHFASIEAWFQAGGARLGRMSVCKSMGVAALLAMAGLGATLLPARCFREELARRQLLQLRADPPFGPIPFRAMTSRRSLSRLAEEAAALAAETSDFNRAEAL